MKKALVILYLLFSGLAAAAQDVWVNDLRTLFIKNSAVIYEINLRTFGAQDTNKNGIIDFDEGEESGNFLNAIARLDELRTQGVNTLHVMPVTPVGKIKALGTAGSLYAAAGFNSLNPQLASSKSALSLDAQARKFFNEAHNRGFRVIVDLPSCGSYDLYMQRPELFVKDKSGQPVIPADWTDVRLLNAGTEANINRDVYNLYQEFVDYMMDLGADGIRADVASAKPASFWKDLIAYSKRKDPQFLWLAEASESWNEPVGTVFTPYNKLLEAGFDGYYGSYFNLKNWKTGKEFIQNINAANNIIKKSDKRVIGSFATHDELSPIVVNGVAFSEMIIWLNAVLPVNSYFVDGFSTGDNYIYLWANKKARKTYTDDEYYFTHRGKLDIFNFSRQPGAKNLELQNQFIMANNFKLNIAPLLTNGSFIPLKTDAASVFAYAISYEGISLVVFGNLNHRTAVNASVSVPKITENNSVIPVKITASPTAEHGKFKVKLFPGEIQALLLTDLEVKR
ncbi:MAG: hypothetical protein LBK53_01340 [Heliobacteriaceae bacterium]|nr:hypothetical protein [Heliobacteriaceae bacterium]